MASGSLKALTFVCTLKPSPAASSTDKLAGEIGAELEKLGVQNTIVRPVDHAIAPGVLADMGEGDAWPKLRKLLLEADIFILTTPTWVGHMTSVAQRVIERLDAELSFTDDEGRLLTYGKVAAVGVVGNEDGAHKIVADLFQSLNDVGFTIPAGASTYWNGAAMQTVDYKDLEQTPKEVASATKALAINAVHLAHALQTTPYPSQDS